MLKRMIAVAVASALVAPVAMADSVNVKIYGKLRVGFESINDTGAGASSTRIVDNASRIGFSGSEDLGDGLFGIWQVETGFAADDAAGSGSWASRNSYVGLRGGFGTLLLGKYDTPYKETRDFIDPFRDTTVEGATVLGKGPQSLNFHTRQSNVLQYHSPEFSGFQVKVSYGPDEAKTATTNKTAFSLGASFKQDDLYVGVAYESRGDQAYKNAAGVASVETATAMRGVVGYKMADIEFGAGLEQVKLGDDKRSNAFLAGTIKFDKLKLIATVSKMGKTDINDGKGVDDSATMTAFGAAYGFSKRTELMGYVGKISNQDGSVNFATNKFSAVNAKESPQVIGFSINHTF